jgi:hypothetical protein
MASKLMIGVAVAILTYLAMDELTRRGRPALRRGKAHLLPWLNWRILVPVLIALPLALLMARPFLSEKEQASPPFLISAYIVAVGILVSWYLVKRAERVGRSRLDKQVADLVLAFRSIYQLQPTIFSTLDEARNKVDEPLRGWVASTVQAFRATSSAKKALAGLRKKADNPYLHQFVYIMEMSDEAEHETVLAALESLAGRLRKHEELQNKTETEVIAITGQVRFILIISVLTMFAIAAINSLRSTYTDKMQFFFMAVAAVGVFTSYYIDKRILSLKERIT